MKINKSRNEREGHFAGRETWRKSPWRSHQDQFQLRYYRWRAWHVANEESDLDFYWSSL